MRNRIGLMVFCLILACLGLAVIADQEYKEYSPGAGPGDLYFISVTNIAGGSLVQTNQEAIMWYPSRVDTIWSSAVTSTNTLDHVMAIDSITYTNTVVVTNEFNNIQTNWVHSAVKSTTYVTNRLATWTNSGTAGESVELSDCYIQRDDILIWSFSNTNAMWLRIAARR
jgi:hypothetical protein